MVVRGFITKSLPKVLRRLRSASGPPKPAKVSPQPYRPGCKYQGRGIEHLDAKLTSAGLPGIVTHIEERLRKHGRCKVLEVGCGEARLLLELLSHFGPRVELHGINHPDWLRVLGDDALQRVNEHYKVMPQQRLRSLPQPTMHLADAQDLQHFPVRGFDVIVSQAVLPHVADKARAIEQTAQLLSPDGSFMHELDRIDTPPLDFLDADLPRFTIYDGRDRVPATEYLRACGIGVLSWQHTGAPGILAVYQNTDRPIRLRLELDRSSTLKLASLVACDVPLRLWGVRSVYRLAA